MLASVCIVATLHPRFRHPSIRPYRATMYAGLGLSALGFVAHGIARHGWQIQRMRMSLDWMALMGALNLLGAVVYAARVRQITVNEIWLWQVMLIVRPGPREMVSQAL